MTDNDTGRENIFEDFAPDYDRMVNWQERLKREAPFYQKLFSDVGAAAVLDLACGTGHHAMMFCSWGLKVTAIDASEAMIQAAQKNALAEACKIDFQVAALQGLDRFPENQFDVITCMGNSLPHIRTKAGLLKTFSGVAKVLNQNGIFILQIRNYHRVYEKNERFMPPNSRVTEGKEYLYLRMNELGHRFINFNIITLEKNEEGKWSSRVETEKLKPWNLNELQETLKKAGFASIDSYGTFSFKPYDLSESTDLIMIARKN